MIRSRPVDSAARGLCETDSTVAAKTALKSTSADEPGSDKLHELYWNRAELKQAYAKQADEVHRLTKQIRDQEGSTARVQQKLDHLENLLLDPEWVHNVVVFYQLRSLNARCCRRLAKFAEQLKQQREQRIHQRHLVDWNERRKRDAGVVEAKIGELRGTLQTVEDELVAERQRVEDMNGISKMFRGRQASRALEALEGQLVVAEADEQNLLAELETIRRREPPEVPGLDVAAKRSINLMILAFAQDLYLRFEDRNLAAMVKESSEKSVGAINYGSREDCDRLLRRLEPQIERLEQPPELADVLKRRVAKIAEHADFGADDESVPRAGTVATLFAFDAGGAVRTSDANLLGEDYWKLSQVLSR